MTSEEITNYKNRISDLQTQLNAALRNYKTSFVPFKTLGTNELKSIFENDKRNVERVMTNIFLLKNELESNITNTSHTIQSKLSNLQNQETMYKNVDSELNNVSDSDNAVAIREKDFSKELFQHQIQTIIYSIGILIAGAFYFKKFN